MLYIFKYTTVRKSVCPLPDYFFFVLNVSEHHTNFNISKMQLRKHKMQLLKKGFCYYMVITKWYMVMFDKAQTIPGWAVISSTNCNQAFAISCSESLPAVVEFWPTNLFRTVWFSVMNQLNEFLRSCHSVSMGFKVGL